MVLPNLTIVTQKIMEIVGPGYPYVLHYLSHMQAAVSFGV
jgi:hypothetical protein